MSTLTRLLKRLQKNSVVLLLKRMCRLFLRLGLLVAVLLGSDVDLTDTSESFGSFPATADLMFALISTEETEGLNQIMVKQLKNRYNDPTISKRFVVGIDRAKMRLYDCEQTAQDNILDSGKDEEYNYEESKPKKSFEGFNF